MKIATLLLILVISFNVLAQDTVNDVTDSQIDSYQRGMESGCKSQGLGKGDASEKVDAVCDCILKVLKAEMSRSEWQRAYFSSRTRNDREEIRTLAPHIKKTELCRANAL
ncbi:hypothetical protein [Variovorax terrae]|uniref:Uncharacterized protein n=1 Tax=Variovorax terrae TaxID=2923278 RepID=A0A9X2APH3_9BURK|nr:hypothetical protein [Variovorax terrae]MCJ0763507.1 hypothetical protein [Variovorax terrae]